MHILLLGGTGACGLAFISHALASGHKLTIYARNPTKLPQNLTQDDSVQVVKGQLDDLDAIKQALKTGAEVLVSFLGPAVPARGMVITEFYERLYPLLPTESSIRRCMVLSTASYSVAEDRYSWKWWFGVWTIRLAAGSAYSEINGLSRATASLPSDKTEWTLFRVPGLTNGEAKAVQASQIGGGGDGLFLSRKSIPPWILQELEERKWVCQAPALSNPGWL